MRNLIVSALLLLCVPLTTFASPAQHYTSTTTQTEALDQVDSRVVDQILHHLEDNYGYDYTCLCDQFANGEITIHQTIMGYQVNMPDSGIILVDIDEGL